MTRGNVFEALPRELPEEAFEKLAGSGSVTIERIVSAGHASPEGFWYDQENHEWVLVLSGSAGLRFENSEETVVLKPGDWIFIAARRKHRVEWTDPVERTVWLAVHYP